MNILVTGASGFVGRGLCTRLIKGGHKVVGLSSRRSADISGMAAYIEQDLAKPFILDQSFDAVIHLAAYNITNVGDKDSDLYEALNVEGTRHLLDAVRPELFVYLSTAKVYKQEGLPLTEDSPLAPQASYEISKLKAEQICLDFFKGGRLVILRSANIIGPGQALKAVLPIFFQKARQNQDIELTIPSRTPLQFIYVEDMIDALEAAIGHPQARGVFNIAAGQPVALEDLARKIIAWTGSSSVLKLQGASGDVPLSPIICDKARVGLGWEARTSLEQALALYTQEGAAHG